jgi:uncharacterized SAM-binding protein YcdF (DUF218 family)
VSSGRLVAVLGYSNGRRVDDLHPICAARVIRAAEEAGPDDVVLFSGWRRRWRKASEAQLMAQAWEDRTPRVIVDVRARTTYGNAVAISAAAQELSAAEIVLVTSGWHGRRASRLVQAVSGRPVSLAATDERGPTAARLRELACWALVPFQLALVGRRR